MIKVWTDAERIYILTDKGDVFGERFADYPRLAGADAAARSRFECDNIGIRWDALDEDLSYRGFMVEAKKEAKTIR